MHKLEKNKPIKASVGNHPKGYQYDFSPALKPDLKNIPVEVTNYMLEVLEPRGGGFIVGKKRIAQMELSASGDAQPKDFEKDVVSLLVPKSVYKDQVEKLFELMQEAGIDIDITTEKYPEHGKKKEKDPMINIIKTETRKHLKNKTKDVLPLL